MKKNFKNRFYYLFCHFAWLMSKISWLKIILVLHYWLWSTWYHFKKGEVSIFFFFFLQLFKSRERKVWWVRWLPAERMTSQVLFSFFPFSLFVSSLAHPTDFPIGIFTNSFFSSLFLFYFSSSLLSFFPFSFLHSSKI